MKMQSKNSSMMEIITAKLRSLQISFSRIFWTSLEMTWEKFKPSVTSTPKKSNLKTIVDCTMKTLSISTIEYMDIDPSPQPSPEVQKGSTARKRKGSPLNNGRPSKNQRK